MMAVHCNGYKIKNYFNSIIVMTEGMIFRGQTNSLQQKLFQCCVDVPQENSSNSANYS